MSKGEDKIESLLKKAKKEKKILLYQKEYSIIIGKSKVPLRFDFIFLRERNSKPIFIEIDGQQHFQRIKHFQHKLEDFKKQQARDRKKNKYCLDKKVKLYRIPYYEIDNIKTFEDIFQNKFLVKSIYHNENLQFNQKNR